MIAAETIITAQFYDLDPMQVVWHGNYPRFLEEARSALLDKIGFNYREMAMSGHVWPIVELRIKYVRPIRLQETVKIRARLLEYECRLKIDYLITNAASGEVLTKAHTTQVAVERATNELCFQSPEILVEKVRRLL